MLMCQLAARTENAAGQLAHFAYQPFARISILAHYHIITLILWQL